VKSTVYVGADIINWREVIPLLLENAFNIYWPKMVKHNYFGKGYF
jgi:hypothetical protein